MSLVVVPVPCLRDNYSYLLFSEAGDGACIIVDACEANPIEAELKRRGLRPCAILTTHHHWDHVGGNLSLSERYALDVFGFENDRTRIPGLNVPLIDGQTFQVAGLKGSVYHVPGHTQGALLYRFGAVAFTGDTLFGGGCGRLLEGTAAQLHQSLSRIVRELPSNTQLYTGHEYTEANLRFASSLVEWPALLQRYKLVQRERSRSRFCATADLRTELATNLFLNCHRDDVQRAVWGSEHGDSLSSFAASERTLHTFERLRQLKDAY